MRIGEKIQYLRAFHGWNQSDLHDVSDVSEDTISRVENATGEYRPRPTSIVKLAGALGVPVEWLRNDALDLADLPSDLQLRSGLVSEFWRLSADDPQVVEDFRQFLREIRERKQRRT